MDDLTPSELLLALDQDMETRRVPTGMQTGVDPVEYARQWRAMSPGERLERAQRG